MYQFVNVVLICTSLKANDVDHLFKGLFAIGMASFMAYSILIFYYFSLFFQSLFIYLERTHACVHRRRAERQRGRERIPSKLCTISDRAWRGTSSQEPWDQDLGRDRVRCLLNWATQALLFCLFFNWAVFLSLSLRFLYKLWTKFFTRYVINKYCITSLRLIFSLSLEYPFLSLFIFIESTKGKGREGGTEREARADAALSA